MILTERRNKIFLIGNGFDLAHGLPTRYIDFIKWYLKTSCLNAIEKGLFEDDCLKIQIRKGDFSENDIEVTEYIEELFQSNSIFDHILFRKSQREVLSKSKLLLKIEPVGEFCKNLLWNCQDFDWSGIEYEINRIMLKEHNFLTKNRQEILINRKDNSDYNDSLDRIKLLNKSVYRLKECLIEYLKSHNDPSSCKTFLVEYNNDWGRKFTARGGQVFASENQEIKSDVNINRDVLFLNFNYTTYFERDFVRELKGDFEDKFTNFETIYIHGDIDSMTEDIVFGVGDENKEIYSEIESLYDDDWLVPLKSFHYFRNKKYQDLLGFINKGDYDIYIIGHSCSVTDRTLLNMLFENDACKKIHVYHYNGINSYLTTAYNIARNFNDKVRLRQVLQPYNSKLTTG
jgi:hypothetical protein